MRTGLACLMALGLSWALVGCGGTTDESEAEWAAVAADPANLQAAGWVGGGPVKLTGEADALRAVFFLDLDSEAAAKQARELSQLSADHPDLILVGATKSHDREPAEAFREKTGFSGPIALGISSEVLQHYHIAQRPALRVVGKDGVVVGREFITLMAHLGRPKTDGGAR